MHKVNHTKMSYEVLQAATVRPTITCEQLQAQLDTGANISITNNRNIVDQLTEINPFPIGHASKGPPMMATSFGNMKITTKEGDELMIPMFYSADTTGTIHFHTTMSAHY